MTNDSPSQPADGTQTVASSASPARRRRRVPARLAAQAQHRASSSRCRSTASRSSLLAEVAQQLGDSRVRAICMKPTDGLTAGTPVRNLGPRHPVPVGDRTLGHVWNVWGDALDDDPESYADMERWDIHRDAAAVDALEPVGRMFDDGHQGHRPADAVRAGRQDRPVRRRRRRQDRAHHRR